VCGKTRDKPSRRRSGASQAPGGGRLRETAPLPGRYGSNSGPGAKARPETKGGWPVEGLISHQAGERPGGFVVVDVWESEEALARFSETVGPILQSVGVTDPPTLFPAHVWVS
jgi:hypothetical protein